MGKRRTGEQIRALLVEFERGRARGLALGDLCRQHGITRTTYYRWQAAVGDGDSGRHCAALAAEVERLKALVGELMLEQRMLRDLAQKKW